MCIFCKIIKGEVPCGKIYEDEHVLVFLDINPISKGHCLVVTKEHYETLLEIPEDESIYLFKALKKIGKALMKGLKADGFNIGMNNFSAAGQVVMHAHFHVIPRFKGDGLKHWPGKKFEEGDYVKEIKRFL